MKKLIFILFVLLSTVCIGQTNGRGTFYADTLAGYYKTPYKVYTVLVTQVGTNDPYMTVFENTLGETPTISRDNIGTYLIGTTTSPFVETNTAIIVGASRNISGLVEVTYADDNHITIITSPPGGGTAIDEVLKDTFIEIRVYP